MSQRTERVDELLRQEIGALLAKEVADPRIGFATITDVETSPDLRHAKVWVSVIGGKADRDETIRALGQAMPFVRHELGRRLRIRRIPELHIRLDDSAERGTRVLHLLQELESGVDPEAVTPFNESLPTPVPRLPHEGDAEPRRAGNAGSRCRRSRPPRRRRAGRPTDRDPAPAGRAAAPRRGRLAGVRARRRDERRRRPRPGSPATPCPRPCSCACAAPGTCWRSATSIPMPTPWGPCWGSASSWRPSGAAPRPSRRTPCRPCTASCPGWTGSAPTRTPREAYDLLVLADCATAERVGDVATRHAGVVRHAAAGDRGPPRLQRRGRRRGLDRSAGGRDLRARRAPRRPPRAAAGSRRTGRSPTC